MNGLQQVSVSSSIAPLSSRSIGTQPNASPEENAIALSTGVTLRYVEQGDRRGVPVVFLHGVTDSWRSFAAVFAHLPASIHAFALSQRGHGDSDQPTTGYRTRDFAADIAAFLDAVGVRSTVLVGHSMGTTNALRFAIDHPERTRGLFTVGTFASFRRNTSITDLWASTIATLTDPIDPGFAREFQQSTLAQPIPSDFLETAVKESLKVPAYIWRAAFAGMLDDACVNELGKVAAPTFLLWGDRDALIPRPDQEALLKAIARARLTVYRGAGHAPHWEEPARFANDLIAFVKSCE